MSTSEAIPGVAPAPATPPCTACGAPLAADQRYCLHCGEPRADARRAAPARPRGSIHGHDAVVAAARLEREQVSLAVILAGLACLLVAMGVGVLIGRGSGSGAASAPVTVAAAPAAAASSPATFTGDWPAGSDGWTVALAVLPKATTAPGAVAAAKTAATAKGAGAVGALDADAYPSLTGGSYVVYSGVQTSEAAATRALKMLAAKFPEARVVRVGATAAAPGGASSKGSARSGATKRKTSSAKKPAAATSTQNEFEKSKKAPKRVGTGGTPPPKDNKAPAGGGGFEDIG